MNSSKKHAEILAYTRTGFSNQEEGSNVENKPSESSQEIRGKEDIPIEEWDVDDLLRHPRLLELFMEDLSRRGVVRDRPVKKVLLLTCFSAYINGINLFMKGPSSIGKTFNTVNVAKYFPPEDVWYLGAMSPTALAHDYGYLEDEEGNILEEPSPHMTKEELEDYMRRLRNAKYIVDMRNRILIFLEAPHPETYARLRPILSHDVWEVAYKFTDRAGRKLKTRTTYIRGWPAAIFCTTREDLMEDLITRGFTITPDVSPDKIKEAQRSIARRYAYKQRVPRSVEKLREVVYRIRESEVDVLIPYAENIGEIYPSTLPRDMRDLDRFLTLIKVHAFVHQYTRVRVSTEEDGEFVLADRYDLESCLEVFSAMEETTRTGLPANVIEFYEKVMLRDDISEFNYSDLINIFYEVYGYRVSRDTIRRKYLTPLIDAGLVNKMPDPTDKRSYLFEPIKDSSGKATEMIRKSVVEKFTIDDFRNWASEIGENTVFLSPDREEITIEEAYRLVWVEPPAYSV